MIYTIVHSLKQRTSLDALHKGFFDGFSLSSTNSSSKWCETKSLLTVMPVDFRVDSKSMSSESQYAQTLNADGSFCVLPISAVDLLFLFVTVIVPYA